MIYDFNISTPASTSFAGRKLTVINISKGILHQLEIVFPPGPRGLLHVTINNALHQVWPTNPDGNFSNDNESLVFRENYEIKDSDKTLYANTWNEDTLYDHIVIVRIGIVEKKSWRLWF